MISVYNTLSREEEDFRPIQDGQVKMFVCGPTVYDKPHIGHGKTYTQFDCIAKYLAYCGFSVDYVQNITDIDDKILQRAGELECDWRELADRYEGIFREEMTFLGNDSVSRYARATDYVPTIIRQIDKLMEKGHAYVTNDGVYFETATFADYGNLAKRTKVRANDAQSRIDSGADKRAWNDFCLWKFPKPGEPIWNAPFGDGRPGWHIEDTAISEAELGLQYDLHGGAIDLIFPHHECEIALMESYSGRSPYVRFWLHTGFLTIREEKMAKSAGNFLTIEDLRKQHSARILRHFFLSSHYRAPVAYSPERLENGSRDLKKVDEFVHNLDPDKDDPGFAALVESTHDEITMKLDADFNVPAALTTLYGFIREVNRTGTRPGRRVNQLLRDLDAVFGFLFDDEAQQAGDTDRIGALVQEREEHRKQKRYAEADRVREELRAMNVKVYDTPDGVQWRIDEC